MSPLKIEFMGLDSPGARDFNVLEAQRIDGIKAHRKLVQKEVIVPNGGVFDLAGPLGELILRGFKNGGVFNGAPLWVGDEPIVVERGEIKATITPTEEE